MGNPDSIMRCFFKFASLSLGIWIALFLCCAVGKSSGQESPKKDKTWLIEATPNPGTISSGDHFRLDVTIKNITDTNQTFDLPNFAWWAHSDNPSVIFPSWPKQGGIGPVVIFNPITVAPGQACTYSWTATIAPATPPGDLTFRMGFRLHSDNPNDYWSSDIKLHVKSGKRASIQFHGNSPLNLNEAIAPCSAA